jgi:hypothetical protein
MFSCIQYEPPDTGDDPLKKLTTAALRTLRSSIVEVEFPDELRRKVEPDIWRDHYGRVDELNKSLLSAVQNKAGVYAILAARGDKDWQLCYIGQAKDSVTRQRVRSHLIWRNKDTPSGRSTGSKFDEVKSAINNGKRIGFSFVEISPPSLRHYVESALITQHHPEWNFHGTTAMGMQSHRKFCNWPRTWPDTEDEA